MDEGSMDEGSMDEGSIAEGSRDAVIYTVIIIARTRRNDIKVYVEAVFRRVPLAVTGDEVISLLYNGGLRDMGPCRVSSGADFVIIDVILGPLSGNAPIQSLLSEIPGAFNENERKKWDLVCLDSKMHTVVFCDTIALDTGDKMFPRTKTMTEMNDAKWATFRSNFDYRLSSKSQAKMIDARFGVCVVLLYPLMPFDHVLPRICECLWGNIRELYNLQDEELVSAQMSTPLNSNTIMAVRTATVVILFRPRDRAARGSYRPAQVLIYHIITSHSDAVLLRMLSSGPLKAWQVLSFLSLLVVGTDCTNEMNNCALQALNPVSHLIQSSPGHEYLFKGHTLLMLALDGSYPQRKRLLVKLQMITRDIPHGEIGHVNSIGNARYSTVRLGDVVLFVAFGCPPTTFSSNWTKTIKCDELLHNYLS